MRHVKVTYGNTSLAIKSLQENPNAELRIEVDGKETYSKKLPPPLITNEPAEIGSQIKGVPSNRTEPYLMTKIGPGWWYFELHTGREVLPQRVAWSSIAVTELIKPAPKEEHEPFPEPKGVGAVVQRQCLNCSREGLFTRHLRNFWRCHRCGGLTRWEHLVEDGDWELRSEGFTETGDE